MKSSRNQATQRLLSQESQQSRDFFNQDSSDQDSEYQQDQQLNQTSQNSNGLNSSRIRGSSSNMTRDLQKLQKKIYENKKRRQNHNNPAVSRGIAVPNNVDTLVLKYGPAPNKSRIMSKDKIELASYKIDAMNLIINRIYRYMGKVFEEMQRKVMRDDIMMKKKKARDANNSINSLKISRNKRENPNNSNSINDSNYIANQDERGENRDSFQQDQQEQPNEQVSQIQQHKSEFQKKFEDKINKIKADTKAIGQVPKQDVQKQDAQTMQVKKKQLAPSQKQNSKNFIKIEDDALSQASDSRSNQINQNPQKYQEELKDFNGLKHQNSSQQLNHRPTDSLQQKSGSQNTYSLQNDQKFKNFEPDESENEEELADFVNPDPLFQTKTGSFVGGSGGPMPSNFPQPEHSDSEPVIELRNKKFVSFMNRENNGSQGQPGQENSQERNNSNQQQYPSYSGVKVGDNKGQEIVEMSFSENPFNRRHSSINQSSMASTQNQNSPEFIKGKESIGSAQSQKLFTFMNNNGHSNGQQSQNPGSNPGQNQSDEEQKKFQYQLQQKTEANQSKQGTFRAQVKIKKEDETSSHLRQDSTKVADQLQQKKKITESIKEIMTEFDQNKETNKDNLVSPTPSSKASQQSLSSHYSYQTQNQSEIYSQSQTQPQPQTSKNKSKLQSLKEQLNQPSQQEIKQVDQQNLISPQSTTNKIEELKRKMTQQKQNQGATDQISSQGTKNNNNQLQKTQENQISSTQKFESPQKVVNSKRMDHNQNSDTVETQLGAMTKTDENTVEFTESRNKKLQELKQSQNEDQKSNIDMPSQAKAQVFQIKQKKQGQQQKQMASNPALTQQQPTKPDIKNPIYQKQVSQQNQQKITLGQRDEETIKKKLQQCDRLIYFLSRIQKEKLKESLIVMMVFSITKSKAQFVDKISSRLIKRRAFRKLKIKVRKQKGQQKLKALVNKKLQELLKKKQRVWWQWKMVSKMSLEIEKVKQKSISSASSLGLILKHKYQQNLKSSFQTIFEYQKAMTKQIYEQTKRRGAQLIAGFLKKKDKQVLNKKFQKYRKQVFLITFDKKLVQVSNLVINKERFWKKESFKEIINFCLKNEQFKKQYDQLHVELSNHKQKFTNHQLKRVVKISLKYLNRQGFIGIQTFIKRQMILEQALIKMNKTLAKYNKNLKMRELSYAMKDWQKFTESERKEEELKIQGAKKIKLMLKVDFNRKLKKRFDLWKQETSNFINTEMTKMNHEKEQTRNTQMEQIIVNLWWASLHKSFQRIKQFSNYKQQFEYVIKRKETKEIKINKASMFNKWKQIMLKAKQRKVNLSVILKNLINRQNKNIGKYFQKWKKVSIIAGKRDELIKDIIKEKLKKQVQFKDIDKKRIFARFKGKYLKEKQIKNTLQEVICKLELNKSGEYFYRWKNNVQEERLEENQIQQVHQIVSLMLMKANFDKLKDHYLIRKQKKVAANKMFKILTEQRQNRVQKGFQNILDAQFTSQKKNQYHQEGVKKIKRILKIIDTKLLQRAIKKWSLKIVDHKSQYERNSIKNKFTKRILQSILNKTKHKLTNSGFQKMKNNAQQAQKNLLYSKLMSKSQALFSDKINSIYIKHMKSILSTINSYGKTKDQNTKVTMAISKLSGVAKVMKILEKFRKDRTAFIKWKGLIKSKDSKFDGFQIINNIILKYQQRYFSFLKLQIQAKQIQNTKVKIGLNMLKVLLYKVYKTQTQRSFQLWLSHLRRPKRQRNLSNLPPRNIKEQENQPPQRIFRQDSKRNSVNNSCVYSQSSKNMRYSNKGEDDEYMYDEEINNQYGPTGAVTNFLDINNQPYEICVSDSQKQLSAKNQKVMKQKGQSQASIFSFFDNEKRTQSPTVSDRKASQEINSQNDQKRPQSEMNQSQNPQMKKGENRSNASSKQGKSSKNHSRKNSGSKKPTQLNKYITSNQGQVQDQSQQNLTKKPSLKDTKIAALDLFTMMNEPKNKKGGQDQDQEQEIPVVQASSAFDMIEQNDQFDKENSNQDAPSSNVISPRPNFVLEPVPEEPIKKRQSKKKGKVGSSLLANKLSNYISANTSTNSNKSKPQLLNDSSQNNKNKKNPYTLFLNKNNNSQSSKSNKTQSDGDIKKQLIDNGCKKLASFLDKKQTKSSLQTIIETVYDSEWDPIFDERKEQRKEQKLDKVLKIHERLFNDGKSRKWDAFALWKRSDYIQMIKSLQMFKDQLNLIYSK